jgi:hypothetical protein
MRHVLFAASRAAAVVVAGALLGSCAFVDAFGPRVYQNTLTFQDANSKEALLNIVRASRYEALGFVAIGQETGSQSETLSAGLPTFTFGAAQTATQRQFAFAGNSLSSNAAGGYQVNPLVSTTFMQGMLTPINAKTLAQMIGTYPREWLFNAVIEGIKLKGHYKANPASTLFYYFRNDPGDDQYDGVAANDQCRQLVDQSDKGFGIYNNESLCNYSKFSDFLGEAVQYGLTSEIVLPSSGVQDKTKKPAESTNAGTNSPMAPQTPSATSSATAAPASVGHLCWDPVLALPKHRQVVSQMPNVCSAPKKASPNFEFWFSRVVFTDVQFIFRSAYGVYRSLGQLLREGSARRIQFYYVRTLEERELNFGPFINVTTQGATADCLVTVFYNGQSYCVPRVGSNSTGMLLEVLGQLKNLSVTPSDVNAAFAVRVID